MKFDSAKVLGALPSNDRSVGIISPSVDAVIYAKPRADLLARI